MKRLLLILPVLAIGMSVLAQPVMKFAVNEHDFGTFKEETGKQSFDFIVSNTGNSPLVIQNVVASCGCTTPGWTKEPIMPGSNGKVSAAYDPSGRPGPFTKTLSVYSNVDPNPVVLTIKGEVIAHEKTIEELFTFPVGPMRFESNHLAFTNVKKTEKKIRVMQMVNTSKRPVKLEFVQLPPYLELKASPETLKPGQKGIVQGEYDALKNPGAWGNVTDMVKMKMNDTIQETLYYYVSANLVEDFSSLTKEQLEKAPVFLPVTTTVDLGKIQGSTANDVEFKFTNAGKSDLMIRQVRSSCGCTAVQQGPLNQGIKPGQSSSIKATFNSGSYNGKVTKAIFVYTNDPKNSEVILMLNADVQQPGVQK
jgi:hypothetical protein